MGYSRALGETRERMPLSFGHFMEERDRCRDRSYTSPDPIIRDGYFCNTDRRWDFTSKEQEYEVSLAPAFRRACIETVITQRMSGSARHSEKPGKSGTFPIMRAALQGKRTLKQHIRTMPFSGRKTYRAVMRREVLANAVPKVAKRLFNKSRCKSLVRLHARLMRYFSPFSARRVEFHSLQIACDLHCLSLMDVKDASDCPLATGSRRGLKWVRFQIPEASVASLAQRYGRPAHSIQTSLCEYDKYRRWTADPDTMRKRQSPEQLR